MSENINENINENKMGIMPVNRLLLTMALPIMASMLVQALYNVVDSYFVSITSREALTAVNLAFSAQHLMIGIASGTGVGINALLSRYLGEKKQEKANSIAANGVFLILVGYAIALLFGFFGTEMYFDGILASATIEETLDLSLVRSYGISYLSICCIYSFGVFGQITFERLMQSTGRTIYTMYTQGIGAIINIILDPIFILEEVPLVGIKGLGMGATGAAVATVIGQIFAFVLAIILNAKYNNDIKLCFRGFRPDVKMIGKIYAIGIPSMIMMGIGSVMNYLMNIIVMGVSAVGATIFGVYFKLQSFVLMPVFGLNNGMIPIISYNYGAGKRKRMTKTIKLAIFYASIFMILGMLTMQIFPDALFGIFESDDSIIALARSALRIISLSFPLAGICIILGAVFQALGNSVYSMIVSFARQIVVLIPAAYLLSLTGVLDNVWWSFPLAEMMSLAVSIIMFVVLYKKKMSKIPLGDL